MEYDLPANLAAAQMGHSQNIHNATYKRWIQRRHHQQAYQRALQASRGS
jgi:hypothetical protein